MNAIPQELYFAIFKFFTASTVKNTMLVNKEFKHVCQSKFIWEKVYNNTIPRKFVNYNEDDFRLLLKRHLLILYHTEWFKRQLFLNFVYERVNVKDNNKVAPSELNAEFCKYSNHQYNSIPSTWYWDSLENEQHQHKSTKFMGLAQASEFIKYEYNGSYIHWEFPTQDEFMIENLELVKE